MRSSLIPAVAVFGAVWFGGMALITPRASSQTPGYSAEDVFKNIQALKGIPVDDFMGTMGIMCAALGFDCSDCHPGAGTVKVDWAADNPRKNVARKMVRMVGAINKDNFSGRQMVTCWSCHHGRDRPSTTPSMEQMYGPASQEMDDVLKQEPGQPAAAQVIDRYLQAIGGVAKLSSVKSFTANGSSVGFGGFGGGGRVQIFAQFPDHRATWIDFPKEPARGVSVRSYDGKTGWLRTPLTVLGEYELSGGELDGARLDALLSFPANIKESLKNLRVSLPTTITDLPGPSSQTGQEVAAGAQKERLVNVVQGTGPRDSLATLYFDQDSGLLVRMVRYGRSPIGRVPTQVDYGDYREVNGIKMPFRLLFAWLGGRDAIQLSDVRTNVEIDPAKFGRPPAEAH
jgi:hypothetical protein